MDLELQRSIALCKLYECILHDLRHKEGKDSLYNLSFYFYMKKDNDVKIPYVKIQTHSNKEEALFFDIRLTEFDSISRRLSYIEKLSDKLGYILTCIICDSYDKFKDVASEYSEIYSISKETIDIENEYIKKFGISNIIHRYIKAYIVGDMKYSSEYLAYDDSFREIKRDKDMINETFGINWRIDGNKLFITPDNFIMKKAGKDDFDDIKVVIGNSNYSINYNSIDTVISKLSKLKGEVNSCREIKRNIYKELDVIYTYIRDNLPLIFLVHYDHGFILKVIDPIANNCIMDRRININDKKYFHFHGYATDEIKETFAKTISYCILEDNKHEGDFEHMWNFIARHMITHIDTFYSINNKEDK